MLEKLLLLENRRKLICQIVHGELRQVLESMLRHSQGSMIQDIELGILQPKLIQLMELSRLQKPMQADLAIIALLNKVEQARNGNIILRFE